MVLVAIPGSGVLLVLTDEVSEVGLEEGGVDVGEDEGGGDVGDDDGGGDVGEEEGGGDVGEEDGGGEEGCDVGAEDGAEVGEEETVEGWLVGPEVVMVDPVLTEDGDEGVTEAEDALSNNCVSKLVRF